jgi:hypothetical protein
LKKEIKGAPGTKKRGYGTALTYYGFIERLTDWEDAITPGLFIRLSKPSFWERKEGHVRETKWKDIFLEYDIDFSELNLTTGYDWYNQLSSGNKHKLADVVNHTIKIGLGQQDSHWYAGYVIADPKLTELGKESELEIKNHFVIGYNLKLGITSK